MLESVVRVIDALLIFLRPLVFAAGALTAIGAVTSWAVRTRRISPFSGAARFVRDRVDPWLIAPWNAAFCAQVARPIRHHGGHWPLWCWEDCC